MTSRLTLFAFAVTQEIMTTTFAAPEEATAFTLVSKSGNIDLSGIHSEDDHRRALSEVSEVVLHFEAFGETFEIELEEVERSVFAPGATITVQDSEGTEKNEFP